MRENASSNDNDVAAMVTASAALNAKTRAEQLESELQDQPFWRFLRRRRLNRGVAVARAMERETLATMGGRQDHRA